MDQWISSIGEFKEQNSLKMGSLFEHLTNRESGVLVMLGELWTSSFKKLNIGNLWRKKSLHISTNHKHVLCAPRPLDTDALEIELKPSLSTFLPDRASYVVAPASIASASTTPRNDVPRGDSISSEWEVAMVSIPDRQRPAITTARSHRAATPSWSDDVYSRRIVFSNSDGHLLSEAQYASDDPKAEQILWVL